MRFGGKRTQIPLTVAVLSITSITAMQNVGAWSFSEIKDLLLGQSQMKSADQTTAAVNVVTSQTAVANQQIAKSQMETEAMLSAIKEGNAIAEKTVKALEDNTVGKGITPSLSCDVVEEQRDEVKKTDVSNTVKNGISAAHASTFWSKGSDKRAVRAKKHYQYYCDITEAAAGHCLVSPGGKPGADVNYANLSETLALDEIQEEAAYAYVKNITDPSRTDTSACTTIQCERLNTLESQQAAIGSMVQGAFLAQIQDSIAYNSDFGGAGEIILEQNPEDLSPEWDGKLEYNSGNTSNKEGTGVPTTPFTDTTNLPDDINALVTKLLELIASSEGTYDAYNRGQACKVNGRIPGSFSGDGKTFITQMTPRQILMRYRTKPGGGLYSSADSYSSGNVDCSIRLFAVGKYQWIPKTLFTIATQNNAMDTVLTPDVQEKLGRATLVNTWRPSLGRILRTGKGNLTDAQWDLAKEWASVATPNGTSYYSGQNANREKTAQMMAILAKIQQMHLSGGSASPTSQKTPAATASTVAREKQGR